MSIEIRDDAAADLADEQELLTETGDEAERLRDLLREALDGWEQAQSSLHAEFCTSGDHPGEDCEPRIDEIRREAGLPEAAL